MMAPSNIISTTAIVALLAATANAGAQTAPGGWGSNPEPFDCGKKPFKRVFTLSIDGLHSSDIEKWLAYQPVSNISALLKTGYEYTDAYTSAPSDSFPGTCAFYTGATPKTTGVWYDDVWDRSLFAPTDLTCSSPGAEIEYDETIDYNSTELFSGGINPANLPRAIIDGKCAPLYPHKRLRVNTIFNVAVKHGLTTAYTDKHPAYDLVRGHPGDGLTLGYFPEINAYSSSDLGQIMQYDEFHINAWLDWLDGVDPEHSEGSLNGKIPELFGGNLQSINVAQKVCGYENDATNSFTPGLASAMVFVDAALGQVVNKLKSKNMLDETLIVVASKHGQAPINPALHGTVDPEFITNATGVPVSFQTSDDIALIFLKNYSDLDTAIANLNANRAEGKIRSVIYGANLTASGFGDPLTDPAVPDIIVQPELGIIYTNNHKKLAEHGGISYDDRVVAAFVSNPSLTPQKFTQQVFTTQFAPTVLTALGLPASKLKGAVKENTPLLPGFAGWH